MQEYLIAQAIDQIWCNPLQDNQQIVKPQVVTQGAGAITQAFLLDRWVNLPWTKERAHVYQVGQLSPALLGLLEKNPSWAKEKWISFSEAMKELPLYMQIYSETGVTIPRFNAYFMWTREKCLIFAIKTDKRIPVDLHKDNIYFRFYTSAYLRENPMPAPAKAIELVGYEVVGVDNISMIATRYAQTAAKPGYTEAFINGQFVCSVSMKNLQQGDIVEWVYDSTVKRTVIWTVKDLKPFTSTLDLKSKYILHYPKESPALTIDYQDDVDVYIQTKGKYDTKMGRYYVKNNPGALRNLTHRDYSINADYVKYISEKLAEYLELSAPDLLEFEIIIKIKEGGYNRKIIQDANRIKDLYRLPDYRILMAMSGVESAVPMWHASSLESADYPTVMRSLRKNITIDKVEGAYGYNSISKMLAPTPIHPTMIGGAPVFDLGYESALGCTVYEYDSTGKMLGDYQHTSMDDDYNPRSPQTKMIETFIGGMSDRSPNYFGTNAIPIPENCSWRLYRCRMDFSTIPPKPMYDWVDITDTDLYEVRNDTIVWTDTADDQYLCLRTDERMVGYTFDVEIRQGTIIFPLYEYIDYGDGLIKHTLDIPYGSTQIYMNDYNLVPGVDYIGKFPNISICNFKFIKQPSTGPQRIHVRMSGFCGKDMKMPKPTEVGFVRNGLLSHDGVFHVYNDKVTHISVAGCVKAQDQVKFMEEGASWNPRGVTNGTPYQIDKVVVPMRKFTESDTYTLLEASKEITVMTDAYLDIHLPKPQNEPLSSSQVRWRLVSPFFACLVDLCSTNALSWEDNIRLTDQQVLNICKPYEGLLSYDPLVEENNVPVLYTNITPIWSKESVNVSRAQYRFLSQAVRLYGRGKIGLNNFLTFTIS